MRNCNNRLHLPVDSDAGGKDRRAEMRNARQAYESRRVPLERLQSGKGSEGCVTIPCRTDIQTCRRRIPGSDPSVLRPQRPSRMHIHPDSSDHHRPRDHRGNHGTGHARCTGTVPDRHGMRHPVLGTRANGDRPCMHRHDIRRHNASVRLEGPFMETWPRIVHRLDHQPFHPYRMGSQERRRGSSDIGEHFLKQPLAIYDKRRDARTWHPFFHYL